MIPTERLVAVVH